MSVDVETLLEDVRGAALALPESTERKSHSAPTFFVRKKPYVYFWDNHHGDGRGDRRLRNVAPKTLVAQLDDTEAV